MALVGVVDDDLVGEGANHAQAPAALGVVVLVLDLGAVAVPPSSVTDTATTWAQTATAKWKVPRSQPLVVRRIAFVLSSLTISSASSVRGSRAGCGGFSGGPGSQ